MIGKRKNYATAITGGTMIGKTTKLVAGVVLVGGIAGTALAAGSGNASASQSGASAPANGSRGSTMPMAAPRPHGGLLVTGVNGDTITARPPSYNSSTGQTTTSITIHVGSSTVYYEDGATTALGSVIPGAYIQSRGTTNSDGSVNASSVVISLPQVRGVVTSAGSGTLTLAFSGPGGGRGRGPAGMMYGSTSSMTPTTTISVAGDATYVRAGVRTYGSVAASDVVVGSRIVAEGTVDSSGALTARRIIVLPLQLSGTVIAVGSNSFTVSMPDGTHTVTVNSTTAYTATPAMSSSSGSVALKSLAAGTPVYVEGTGNSDGSVTALLVSIGGPGGFGGPGGPGGGPHGHKGHGPKPGGRQGPPAGYGSTGPMTGTTPPAGSGTTS